MKWIQEASSGRELVWARPRWMKVEYELRAGEEVLATLRWPKSWSSRAEASAAGEDWTFQRGGSWSTRASIRRAGSEADLATFEQKWWSGKGTLKFAHGVVYSWESDNLWWTRFVWKDAAGRPLARFRTRGMKRRESSRSRRPPPRSPSCPSW